MTRDVPADAFTLVVAYNKKEAVLEHCSKTTYRGYTAATQSCVVLRLVSKALLLW